MLTQIRIFGKVSKLARLNKLSKSPPVPCAGAGTPFPAFNILSTNGLLAKGGTSPAILRISTRSNPNIKSFQRGNTKVLRTYARVTFDFGLDMYTKRFE